jgi:hypothetical protein
MNFRESASPSPVPSTFLSAVPTCRNSSNTASAALDEQRYFGPNTSMAIRPAFTAQGQPA